MRHAGKPAILHSTQADVSFSAAIKQLEAFQVKVQSKTFQKRPWPERLQTIQLFVGNWPKSVPLGEVAALLTYRQSDRWKGGKKSDLKVLAPLLLKPGAARARSQDLANALEHLIGVPPTGVAAAFEVAGSYDKLARATTDLVEACGSAGRKAARAEANRLETASIDDEFDEE